MISYGFIILSFLSNDTDYDSSGKKSLIKIAKSSIFSI